MRSTSSVAKFVETKIHLRPLIRLRLRLLRRLRPRLLLRSTPEPSITTKTLPRTLFRLLTSTATTTPAQHRAAPRPCRIASRRAALVSIARVTAPVCCTRTQSQFVANKVRDNTLAQRELHSNSIYANSTTGCVEAPQDCDQWEFTDHDIALAGPETADYEQVAAAANAREGSDDDDVNSEHCKACRDAGYECSKKCGADDMICKALCLCASTAEDNCGKCRSVDCPRT